MGKKQKLANSPSSTDSNSRAHGIRFRKRLAIIVGIVVPVVVALIGLLPQLRDFFKAEAPQFALANLITRPDSGVTIIADNSSANRQNSLNAEFDGLLFQSAGRVIRNTKPQRWHFALDSRGLPDSLLCDGPHRLRVGFAGKPLSEVRMLVFHTQAPVVEAEIIQPPDKPSDRIFAGRVASRLQAPAETLAVDIVFHHEGYPQQIPVPVRRVTDEATGLNYFEFETEIQGLPKIPPEDPRYADPFFAFRVTDQAGNQYYHQESYAQFTAPGDKRFGINKLADIEVAHLPPDLHKQSKVAFRVVPKPKLITYLPDGKPAIILKVTSLTGNIKELQWTNLPENVRTIRPLTVIIRDEHKLAISFGNRYTDEHAPRNYDPSYRVEQIGSDNKVYTSKTVKVPVGGLAESVPKPEPSTKAPAKILDTSLASIDRPKTETGKIAEYYQRGLDALFRKEYETAKMYFKLVMDSNRDYQEVQRYYKEVERQLSIDSLVSGYQLAFAEKNWHVARYLLMELIDLAPDSTKYIRDLNIAEREVLAAGCSKLSV